MLHPRDTNFTKEEVKSLYRAFKQECLTAILDEDTFKEVYQKIFPLGDSSKYAKLVFNTIDRLVGGGSEGGEGAPTLPIYYLTGGPVSYLIVQLSTL